MKVLARRVLVGLMVWATAISIALLSSIVLWWLWENVRLVVYALGALGALLVIVATGEIVIENK